MTKAELGKLPTSEILALFNKITGRSTKKFASRTKGIEQTIKAIGTLVPLTTDKSKKRRSSAGMSFRLAPKDEVKVPRSGTKRALVLEMISKPGGALFSAIRLACIRADGDAWNLKDTYEGVRLLNVFCGYGLWHEGEGEGDGDYRISLVDAKTFQANVQKTNAAS